MAGSTVLAAEQRVGSRRGTRRIGTAVHTDTFDRYVIVVHTSIPDRSGVLRRSHRTDRGSHGAITTRGGSRSLPSDDRHHGPIHDTLLRAVRGRSGGTSTHGDRVLQGIQRSASRLSRRSHRDDPVRDGRTARDVPLRCRGTHAGRALSLSDPPSESYGRWITTD